MSRTDGGYLKTYVLSSANPYEAKTTRAMKSTVKILSLLILTIASSFPACRHLEREPFGAYAAVRHSH
jgi:hypothetical protein